MNDQYSQRALDGIILTFELAQVVHGRMGFRPMKGAAEEAYGLLEPHCATRKEFDGDDIAMRMMAQSDDTFSD